MIWKGHPKNLSIVHTYYLVPTTSYHTLFCKINHPNWTKNWTLTKKWCGDVEAIKIAPRLIHNIHLLKVEHLIEKYNVAGILKLYSYRWPQCCSIFAQKIFAAQTLLHHSSTFVLTKLMDGCTFHLELYFSAVVYKLCTTEK